MSVLEKMLEIAIFSSQIHYSLKNYRDDFAQTFHNCSTFYEDCV